MTSEQHTAAGVAPSADDDGSEPIWSSLAIDAVVVEQGARALLAVRPEPPGLPPSPEAMEAAPARARAALAKAGVVHGIDESAVAAATAQPGEAPVQVAAATPPTPPVDAVIDAPPVERAAVEPLFTVPAAAPLARRSVALPGAAGVDVTGAPIPPPDPRTPPLEAGAGAEAHVDEEGALEIRSAIGGHPVMRGGTVTVADTVRCDGLSALDGARHIHCTLVVTGDVDDGAAVTASGLLVVGGLVSHSRIDAELGVAVTGSCVGGIIRAGAAGAARARLLERLRPALEELEALRAAAQQLVDGTAGGPRPVTAAAALQVLLTRRHPELPARWAAAAESARAGASVAGMQVAAAAISEVSELLARTPGGDVTMSALAVALAPVAQAADELGAMPTGPADVRAGYLQACTVEASGSLVITGAGTYNTDAVVAGDLLAEAPGATVRGGRFTVGGVVRVAELGAPAGARVEVTLAGDREPGEYLRAGEAHPGVEIVVGHRRISIEHRTLNLVVAGDDNSHVTQTGEIPER